MAHIAKPLIVPAIRRHTASVILAHGLGDSGAGWIFLAENWRRRSKFEEVSFIFPNAPAIPITINFGMKMPGWYDIKSLDNIEGREEDDEGIEKTRQYFHELIKSEMDKGIPANRIVLGGFSQGGAMALTTGLRYPQKLGGIFCMSGYLLLAKKLEELIPEDSANKETPLFLAHGDRDNVVNYKYALMSRDWLRGHGYNVDFNTYQDLSHSADVKEIDDLDAFLSKQIPPLGEKDPQTSL